MERGCHASPSFQDRLRLQIDDVRSQLNNARDIAALYASQGRLPPDEVRRDVDYLQDRYSLLQSTLEDSLESSTFHGFVPSPAAHAAASPALNPIAYRFSSRSSQRYDQRVASSDMHVLGGRPRSRESLQASPRRPSSHRRSTSRRSLSPRRTPSPARRRSASRRTPSPAKAKSLLPTLMC